MKAAGYIRVSSRDQVEGTSLEGQQKQIEAYCTMKGIELVAMFTDTITSAVPLSERPQGRLLTDMVARGEVQAVIIVKLDRAFRNVVNCIQTVESLDKLSVALHIIDLGGNSIDTTSPAGRFMLTVLAAAAEMERGMIRERCNTGRRVRKAEGRRIGEVPFGFTLADDNKTLVVDSDEQEAIHLAMSMQKDGHSFRAIAKELIHRGIPCKKGGTAWTHKQVASLLRRAA